MRARLIPLAVFVVLSCGLAWLVALPLWILGPTHPMISLLFQPVAIVMMFTPLLAVLVVTRLRKHPRGEQLRYLGVWPLRPAKRVVWFMAGAALAPAILTAITVAVSAAFGWLKLDLVHFSLLQQNLDAQLEALGAQATSPQPPIALLVVLQLVLVPFAALFNAIPASGEEIGWRGWLLPTLRPMGRWPALILTGVIWGLWHSPLILLGYNFGRTDWTGVALMTIGCVFWGMLFGWVRLRSGSVWPAAIGHGALNASGGMFLLFGDASQVPDPALVSPLGVSGWIVVALAVVVLLVTRQFRHEPELAASRKRPVAQPVQAAQAPRSSDDD